MAKPLPEVDVLIRWSCQQFPAGNREIGSHAVARVLTTLASFAGPDATAWPSSQTLADNTGGMSRRQVRAALVILETEGYIKKVGTRSRANRWSFPKVDMAGYPATSEPREVAGYVAGEVAGYVAGHVAGYPATSRDELSSSPVPHQSPNVWDDQEPDAWANDDESQTQKISAALHDALTAHGIPSKHMASVLDAAKADPSTTHAEARLKKSAQYAKQCMSQAIGTRDTQRNTGPRCEEHTDQPAAYCIPCIADVKCGDRSEAYIGKRLPAGWAA